MPKKNYNTFGPYKRNGKWFFKYEEPGSEAATQNGKPRLLSGGTFSAKKICESQIKAKDREINDPDYFTKQQKERKRAKAEDYGNRWIELQSSGKPNTVKNAKNIIRNYFIPHFEGRWMDEITPSDVQEFVNWMTSFRSPGTVRMFMGYVAALFYQAKRDRVITDLPIGRKNNIKLPPKPKSKNHPFEDDEVDLILKAVDHRFRPMVLIMATTGIRCGEAFALTWDRIDLDKGTAYIDRQVQYGKFCRLKGEKGETLRPFTIRLHPAAVEALKKHRENSVTMTVEWEGGIEPEETVEMVTVSATGLVLYGQLFLSHWNKVLDSLSWSRRGNGPHRLRHYFAVKMIEDGASPGEVKVALNHSHVMITMTEYGDRWERPDERLWSRTDRLFARFAA
ncbi:site-specific integrase [Actinomadura fulvescens]|uniref:Site-specific integrase n=1 Tax=Actinomadura fulvescens TaxID=46160 RepID=A0ABP6C396_9ACTN